MSAADLPKTMTCVIAKKPGGPEVLEYVTRAIPALQEDEILIRVEASGVSRPDILQRLGRYALPKGANDVLGLEIAGTVVARGSAVKTGVGASVCALMNGGGYSNYAVVKEALSLPFPRGFDAVAAAAIPEACFTVWYNLVEVGILERGERVLLHGGTSGVGTFAIQIAKALGARVFATCGDERKVDICKKLGADYVINYQKQDFAAIVAEHTDHQGVELIMDMVGGDYFAKNIDCLAMDGRLIEIAYLRGAKVEMNIDTIMNKRLTITGSKLRPLPMERKTRLANQLHRLLWPMLESGRVKPVVDKVFPFREAAAAHKYLESGQHVGKIILKF